MKYHIVVRLSVDAASEDEAKSYVEVLLMTDGLDKLREYSIEDIQEASGERRE